MKRIRELDGLRFFAIVGVLVAHFCPSSLAGASLLSLGWIGVDLFFVISGFLITTILISLRGTQSPYRTFYWRRALRIFPPYYLVLALLCGIQLINRSHLPVKGTLESLTFLTSLRAEGVYQGLLSHLHGAQYGGKGSYVHDHLFARWSDGITVFWSLSVEELFYLFWAPVVLRCSRLQVLAVSLSAIGLCPIMRVLCHGTEWSEYYFFPCRIDSLMMGSLLSLLFFAYSQGEIRRSTLIPGLRVAGAVSLCCLVVLCLHDGVLNHVELRSTLSFTALGYTLLGLAFASLVGLCVMHTGSGLWWIKLLNRRPLVYVGTVSYMMYLVHLPVWVAILKLARPGTTLEILVVGLLSLAVTIALAGLSWRWFEMPILKFKNVSFAIPAKVQDREDEVLHPLNRLRRVLFVNPRQLGDRRETGSVVE
jgi:peptidoglycan/LPS O-acetylase OafA/YrhL